MSNPHNAQLCSEPELIVCQDANTFCTMLEPKLFSIDLEVPEHKIFFTELVTLCEAEDTTLQKLPCYKSVKNLAPLRKSALRRCSASLRLLGYYINIMLISAVPSVFSCRFFGL